MTGERWQRLQELFHQALEVSASERDALVGKECANDPALRAELERLLAAHDRAGGLIDQPAIDVADIAMSDGAASQIGRRVGAYRLVRVLGRGGMGAVYLAERDDGAFEQRVAIKLIKRGMDTDQVLARFRAERQILASLDHPHIARLLDGGTTTDGVPYFGMEYIEGQPIDSFVATCGLGVEGRLRLFIQVCDAVSYAHSKGVIHRDIKPLNTLVTAAGVPKLLDFGIAKVMHDSPEDDTATVTGMRLLTPDYASPEQIEGRPATAASDVYSLGVLLYELLTGRSPYRVTSRAPQEIAQAVCTAEPDRPSTVVTQPAGEVRVRRGVPTTAGSTSPAAGARQLSRRLRGDLDTIVLTALRKQPAERYVSVEQLMEDIRRHLEGRPIVVRRNETAYRMTRLARRHRTPLLTGAAAIATVVLLNSNVVLFSREASDPTLMAMQSIALRDRIVVADFANFTTDSVLAAAITEAFRTDLSQSPVVVVMTPRQVRSSLSNMRQSPEVALSDSLARELALRQGVKAIVTGSLTQISGTFTINVQLVAARSGEALAAVRESAADSTKLIDAVDRASKALRQRIGESLRDLEQMPSLEKATTASLPALRMYSEAQRLALSGNRTAAIQHFERSIALDTGFASAHLGLAMAYGAIGDEGRSFDAAEHALANRERLPFLERSFLVASRAYSQQDYEAAIRAYNTIVERFPENIFALNNLALAHRDARQFAVAESLFRRAARADTTIANFLFGLHNTQILQGKFAEGAATLDTLQRRFPHHPVHLTEVLQDAAAQQDWRRAELTARKQIEEVGADTLQLVDPYEALAQIAMARGRLAESERLWETHAKVSRAAGVMSRHLFGVLQRGYLTLRYRNDAARAVAFVDSALGVTPLDRLLAADRRYDEVARFYLAAGQPARAGPLLAAAVVNDSTLHRTLSSERYWTRGLLALTSGRVAAAIDTLRLAADRHVCPSCVLPDLGRAYERAGRLQEAATTYQRYLTTPWTWRYEPDAVELGWTLWRLADVSERLGDATRARSAWSQLLSLWDGADPAMLATIDAARARLQRLGTR